MHDLHMHFGVLSLLGVVLSPRLHVSVSLSACLWPLHPFPRLHVSVSLRSCLWPLHPSPCLHVSVSLSSYLWPLHPFLFLVIILLSLSPLFLHTWLHTQTDIPSVFLNLFSYFLFFLFFFWPKFYFFNSFIKIYFLYRIIHPNKV